MIGSYFGTLTWHQVQVAALKWSLSILEQSFKGVRSTILENYTHWGENILRIRLVFCPEAQSDSVHFELIFLGKSHLHCYDCSIQPSEVASL